MKLNNHAEHDGAICADPPDEKGDSSSGSEIELYTDLISFSELPAEEKLQSIVALRKAVEEARRKSEQELAQQAALAAAPASDPETSVVAPSSFRVEAPVARRVSAPLISNPTLAQTNGSSADLTPKPTRASDSLAEFPAQPASISAVVEPAAQASSNLAGTADSRPVTSPKPSGPLSGFNLPPNIVYTGTIAAGACISCGAETGEEDLFCVACGGFVDEIHTSVVIPKCAECKKEISSGEMFCPFCGAATTG
jgi:hypothetical protein